jgi:hypothetical protein
MQRDFRGKTYPDRTTKDCFHLRVCTFGELSRKLKYSPMNSKSGKRVLQMFLTYPDSLKPARPEDENEVLAGDENPFQQPVRAFMLQQK